MARQYFDEQLKELNQEMIHMGMLCETAIKHASEAVFTHNVVLAESLPELQEEMNENDRKIESISMRILLQQQPVARDLRYVSSAQKMVTDMKRICVQSADIAEIVTMNTIREVPKDLPLRPMSVTVIGMVSHSIDAFVHRDERLAREVIAEDDIVDGDFNEIRQKLILRLQHGNREGVTAGEAATGRSKKDGDALRTAADAPEGMPGGTLQQTPDDYGAMILDLLMVSKYLERIGDHAVNIAGWVCYSVTGVREGA